MRKQLSDMEILMFCEELKKSYDITNILDDHDENDSLPVNKRFARIAEQIMSEQRLIEDISLPGRLMVEHFSLFLGKMYHTVGFSCQNIKTGRGMLHDICIGEWGTITLNIGDASINWRDADVTYMFYPDRITLRSKNSSQEDIEFFFSFSFKYAQELLARFQRVRFDDNTTYWHDSLTIS